MRMVLLTFLIVLAPTVVAAADEPENKTIDDLFNQGADAYNKRGDFDTALELMNRVIEADPDHDGALYYRARVHIISDELDEADKDIDRALALRPDEQRYLYLKGRIFEKRGNTQPAIEWYSKALEHGFHSEALHGRIRVELEAGEHEKALADCDWLRKHEPKPETTMLRARALLGLSRYAEALAECDDVLGYATEEERAKRKEEDKDKEKEKERTATNFLVRAQVHLSLGDTEKAYYDIVTASWLEETKVEPILALGEFFLLYRPDYRQAIAYYTAAIEVDDFKEPKSALEKEPHEPPIARLRRGQAYVALDAKRFAKQALEDFARYIELEPDKPEGYAERGKLSLSLGEQAKALSDLRKALELDPDNEEYRKLIETLTAGQEETEPSGSKEELQ